MMFTRLLLGCPTLAVRTAKRSMLEEHLNDLDLTAPRGDV